MSTAPNKRQQARNERMLQDLIKTIPGNNVCADCQARNPGWASWSLGIFICMRCAALHRKIGTHITKVKSLSMDSWSNDQVETMRRIGNIASNRIYNPQNAKIPISFDEDETDAAMERFIRQKYQTRQNAVKSSLKLATETTDSDDQPPPLPPKPGNRFGIRSVSSIFPISSKYKKESIENNKKSRQRSLSPRKNKPSRVFGATVEGDNDIESKNSRLCEMGFTDESTNLSVLRGLEGNLEKSIEALVCLSEGNAGGAKGEQKAAHPPLASPTELSGLSNYRLCDSSSLQSSTNPFDRLDPNLPIAPPQSSQSTGGLRGQTEGNPYLQAPNSKPTGHVPTQSPYDLSRAYHDMSLNNPQPLFPNRTGPGFPGSQPPQNQLHLQPMTLAIPSLPQQNHPTVNYEYCFQQPQQTLNSNPYMQQLQKTSNMNLTAPNSTSMGQQFMPHILQWKAVEQSVNPPNQLKNPYLNQLNGPQPGIPFPDQMNSSTPGLSLSSDVSYQKYELRHFQLQPRPIMPQQPVKADTRSILDLYNYPQLAPSRPVSEQQQNQEKALSVEQQPKIISDSLASPTINSRNPFASSFPSPAAEIQGEAWLSHTANNHVSQESISADAGGWLNGRHSPDAWRSISARSTR